MRVDVAQQLQRHRSITLDWFLEQQLQYSTKFQRRQPETSPHISRRRSRITLAREINQLDSKILGHCAEEAVCTYSLSGKICRHSLNDHP
jgi:hypothetical protein